MNNYLKFLPSTVFFLFMLLLILLADLDKRTLVFEILRSIPFGDKIAHFTLFGMLALLVNISLQFKQIEVKSRQFHLGSVLVLIFAIMEEFSQLAFSSRTFDLVDMLFDLFGIGLLSSVSFRRFVIRKLKSFTEYLDKALCIE